MIAERPMVVEGGATLHFIDDRFETVQTAAANADLRARGVKIYFASWSAFRCACLFPRHFVTA